MCFRRYYFQPPSTGPVRSWHGCAGPLPADHLLLPRQDRRPPHPSHRRLLGAVRGRHLRKRLLFGHPRRPEVRRGQSRDARQKVKFVSESFYIKVNAGGSRNPQADLLLSLAGHGLEL